MIHSQFRAASTYFFSVFRKNVRYWCYQEPFHEGFTDISDSAQWMEQTNGEIRTKKLRHPELERPYFYEYTFCSDFVKGAFDSSFSFELYHLNKFERAGNLYTYINGLIERARGIPVFKFCRSIGRLSWLKENFNATHLGLVRDPQEQWASYKINSYFPLTVGKILDAPNAPKILSQIASIFYEFDEQVGRYYASIPYEERRDIFRFLNIWIWTKKNLEQYVDVLIDIDDFSLNKIYREKILLELNVFGVDGLSFDDCYLERRSFDREVSDYFMVAESYILEKLEVYLI